MTDERSTFYTGPRSWPVSAAVSLFGTTSGLLSLVVPKPAQLPGWLALAILLCLVFFFCAALWMSALGWGSLISGSPTEEVGSWTVRGRRVPRKVWVGLLWFCYLAPWIAIATVMGLATFRALGRQV